MHVDLVERVERDERRRDVRAGEHLLPLASMIGRVAPSAAAARPARFISSMAVMATHFAWRMSKHVSIRMASTRSSIMTTDLRPVGVGERVEVGVDGRVGERRHLRSGADGADDEPRPVRRC